MNLPEVRILKPYSLIEARSAEEALRLFRERDREIDLCLPTSLYR